MEPSAEAEGLSEENRAVLTKAGFYIVRGDEGWLEGLCAAIRADERKRTTEQTKKNTIDSPEHLS
jgi:hypothetical protein